MKKNLFLCVLGVVACTSCSRDKETIDVEKKEPVTISVSSQEDETRAYWKDPKICWEEDDKVMVYATYHTDGSKFTRTGTYFTGKSNMDFTGETYFNSEVHTHEYIFVYPYVRALAYDGDNAVTVEIPDAQNAVLDSFDPTACIQIGSTGTLNGGSNMIVNLQNVCAFLKITVDDPCDWVKVTSDGNYGVGGKLYVSKEAVINPNWIDRYPTVTLSNLSKPGTYLIAIGPSQNDYPVLNVEVKFTGVEKTLKNSISNISITKGFVYNLGEVAAPSNN